MAADAERVSGGVGSQVQVVRLQSPWLARAVSSHLRGAVDKRWYPPPSLCFLIWKLHALLSYGFDNKLPET